jgi:cytochrome c peroxidase
VTGHGKEASFYKKKYSMEEGVTCEACHGAGSEYNDMKVMKQITAGEVNGADYGLIDPDEANCVSCHNEKSPTYKGFDYKEYVARIAHPTPEK